MTVTINEPNYEQEQPGEIAKIVLRFPLEIRLDVLRDASEKHEFGIFWGIATILLDAPMSEGGLATEVIDAIWQEHNGVEV